MMSASFVLCLFVVVKDPDTGLLRQLFFIDKFWK